MTPHQHNFEQCWKLRFTFLQCETFPLLSYHVLNGLWLFLQHIISNIGTTIPLGMTSFYFSLLPELPYSCLLCPDLQPLSPLPLHNVDPVDLIFFPLCLAVRCLLASKKWDIYFLLQLIWPRTSLTILYSLCSIASSCCLLDYPLIVWSQPFSWYLWKAWNVKEPILLCELLCSDICAYPKLTNDLSQTH